MAISSSSLPMGYGRSMWLSNCISAEHQVVNHILSLLATGTPPRFIQEPEDMVVFAMNADMSRASLTLNCNASGDPSLIITWYHEGTRLSDNLISANGSLLIVNITEVVDATRGGLSYHCTATNKFGTICSRTANISYACELGGKIYHVHIG